MKTSRRCIKMSMLMIRLIFEILLDSIVCFLQFSSSYFQVRSIIKVMVVNEVIILNLSKQIQTWLLK